MRYENLRWLLVIAGIGLLVIFHKSNSNQNEQKWQDEAPEIQNIQASLADSLVQNVAKTDSKLQRLGMPDIAVPNSHSEAMANAAPMPNATPLPNATLSLARSLPMPSLDGPEFVELEAPEFSEASNQPFDHTNGEVAPTTSMAPEYPLASDEFSADLDIDTTMTPMMDNDPAGESLQRSGHLVKNPFEDTDEGQAPPMPASNQLPPAMPVSTAVPRAENAPPLIERPAFPERHNVPQAVEVRAVHHVEYGKSLARRGALYAARQEFYGALRIVAQSIDIQTGTQDYSRGLSSAFTAMKEADDFYRQQVDVEYTPDVQRICSTHQTKILSKAELARLSPAQAMQAYYAYAQQLMVRAGGNSVVAGEALYSLGRLYTAKAKGDSSGRTLDMARAIVHHQAALEIDPQNFRSANEVGVLLSQTGQLQRSAEMLQRSLQSRQTAKAWNNLAQVHQRMSATADQQTQMEQSQLAQMAQVEYQRMLQQPISATTASVQWVEPTVFSQMPGERVPERTASSANQTLVEPPAEESKSIMGHIRSGFNKLRR